VTNQGFWVSLILWWVIRHYYHLQMVLHYNPCT
jgi:hypothetical protein